MIGPTTSSRPALVVDVIAHRNRPVGSFPRESAKEDRTAVIGDPGIALDMQSACPNPAAFGIDRKCDLVQCSIQPMDAASNYSAIIHGEALC